MVVYEVMSKSFLHHPDSILVWSLAVLIFIGLLMLFSSSMVISKEKTQTETSLGTTTYYFFHQILYGFLPGIVFFYFFSKFSLKFLKKSAPFLFILSLILLIFVFIPGIGFESGGATRWLEIGSFTFQPSEFAKLALIIYLAALLQKKIKEEKIGDFKNGFLPFLFILAPFGILLLLQPDMGTLGILCFIALLMFFAAGGSFLHTLFLIFLGIAVLAATVSFFPYQAERILTFLNPEEDSLGISYQVNQSLIALGSGGILGVGFGNGIQKYNYLPQPMGDTIFAVWAEETGFVGSSIVVLLFLIICLRGLIISKRIKNKFCQLVAIGIISWISIQAFLHIMAVCGLIPFSGMPLPFVSYGGSALILILSAAGILINISKRTIR